MNIRQRNAQILKRFKTENHSALAKSYGLSINTIKGIIQSAKPRVQLNKSHIPREQWRKIDIPSTLSYFVSNYGRIKSIGYTGELLLNPKVINGYYAFDYTNHKTRKRKSLLIHRAVAQTFKRPLQKGEVVIHNNFIPTDNRLSNLKIVTKSEGVKRAHKTHLETKKLHRSFKLTEAEVKKIKRLVHKTNDVKNIAAKFNITSMQVNRIHRGESWAHVLPHLTRTAQLAPSTDIRIVKKIKSLLAENKLMQIEIANLLNVSPTIVNRIKQGKFYKSV